MSKVWHLFPFTCLVLLIGSSFLQVKAQAALFDITKYSALIEPDLVAGSVKGQVVISFSALKNNLAEIRLNAGALEIDAVKDGKSSLAFEKTGDSLIIRLIRPAKNEETRKVEIDYHGTPKYGIKFFPEQKQIYTIFSTSQWMPCIDAPDERAEFSLRLVLPAGLTTVSNGRFIKQEKLANGKVVSEWNHPSPVPSYLYGFVAGQFREIVQKHRHVNLRFLAAMQFTEEDVKQIFRETAGMLDFYENKSGVKYPAKTYTQILALGNAQQEMSDFAALNEEYGRGVLKDEKDIWLGVHEFAHQWWGNSVTNRDWTHFWLNEGITNFMTAAYLEHRFGHAEYLSEIERYRQSYEKVRDAGKDKSLVFPNWNKPTREDRRLVYDKGAYVMHLLRAELGEDLFWKGIKAYTMKYQGKSVTTADFQKSMETASDKDLSVFFNQWVYLTAN